MNTNETENKNFYHWVKYQLKRKRSFRLWLERTLAGPAYFQIIAAFFLFVIVFMLVTVIHYGGDWGKAFADMSSPVSLRGAAYHIETVKKDHSGSSVVISNEPSDKSTGELIWIYFVGTIVFSGLLIATITNVIRSWIDRFKQGLVSYRFFREHIVILGYNDMVPGVIEKMCGSKRYPEGIRVVVGVKKDVPEVSTQLSNHLSKRQWKCVVVLQADCCKLKDLVRLRVHRAKEVYILGEHDDAYSLNSYGRIRELCKNKGKTMPECYVQLQFQSTFALFQRYQGNDVDDLKHFHAFNFHDILARQILMNDKIDTRQNGQIKMDSTSDKKVHLVIVGMSEMGEALAREAAFLCHYPNYVTKRIRTQITLIDSDAKKQMSYFIGRYHHLFELCHYTFKKITTKSLKTTRHTPQNDYLDIEFEFIEANIAEEKMQGMISSWAQDTSQILSVAICMELPHQSMAAGLYLPEAVFDPDKKIPIWVYQPAKGDLSKYLMDSSQRFMNVTIFGMTGTDVDVKNAEIVKQAKRMNYFHNHFNDANRNYKNETVIEKEWKDTIMSEKWSSIYNVSAIKSKIRNVGVGDEINNVENREQYAHVEHNRWNLEKLLMGFRPTTDNEHLRIIGSSVQHEYLKTFYKERFVHDDIRPFDELPNEEKNKYFKYIEEIQNIINVEDNLPHHAAFEVNQYIHSIFHY